MTTAKKQNSINKKRRRFLITATSVVGSVGLVAAAIPFVAYMNPSSRARSAGAPVEVDISKLEPGQQITVAWRSKPVWILRRTPEMLAVLSDQTFTQRLRDPDSIVEQQPSYAQNTHRSIKHEYLVVIGICTHLGCVPTFRPEIAAQDLGAEWQGGYFCPCHGSRFDLAGRVYKKVPAPTNLVIPPHHYLSDTVLEIGVGSEPAGVGEA